MRWYLQIIIASTLITCSHFFFRGSSSFAEWTAWTGSQMVGGTSILCALTMYLSTSFQKIGIKLLTLVYLVLCCFEFGSWALNGFHHQWWASSLIMVLVGLYWLVSAKGWDLKNIQGDKICADKIYFVFRKPDSLLTWFGSLFGYGVGSVYVVYNGSKYYMSRHFGKFKKISFFGLNDNEIAFQIIVDGYWTTVKNDEIIEDIESLAKVGVSFDPVKANCLTVLEDVIKKYHIVKPKSILPSQYFQNFIKK